MQRYLLHGFFNFPHFWLPLRTTFLGDIEMRDLNIGKVSLRKLNPSDKYDIARLADNKNVWNNLTDLMPNPYSVDDAVSFIKLATNSELNSIFGIEYDTDLCGIIG